MLYEVITDRDRARIKRSQAGEFRPDIEVKRNPVERSPARPSENSRGCVRLVGGTDKVIWPVSFIWSDRESAGLFFSVRANENGVISPLGKIRIV